MAKKGCQPNAKHDPSRSKSHLRIGDQKVGVALPRREQRPNRSKSPQRIGDITSSKFPVSSPLGSHLGLLSGPPASSQESCSNTLEAKNWNCTALCCKAFGAEAKCAKRKQFIGIGPRSPSREPGSLWAGKPPGDAPTDEHQDPNAGDALVQVQRRVVVHGVLRRQRY